MGVRPRRRERDRSGKAGARAGSRPGSGVVTCRPADNRHARFPTASMPRLSTSAGRSARLARSRRSWRLRSPAPRPDRSATTAPFIARWIVATNVFRAVAATRAARPRTQVGNQVRSTPWHRPVLDLPRWRRFHRSRSSNRQQVLPLGSRSAHKERESSAGRSSGRDARAACFVDRAGTGVNAGGSIMLASSSARAVPPRVRRR
jgi:hypothetical protein